MWQIRLTLCVWMESAGEGSRVGSKELLCPLAGPLPEEEAASGSHYWLTEEPASIIKTITSLNQALFYTPETFFQVFVLKVNKVHRDCDGGYLQAYLQIQD